MTRWEIAAYVDGKQDPLVKRKYVNATLLADTFKKLLFGDRAEFIIIRRIRND
jgi:hypothetical protein